jgi:hypothetical protein
MLRIRHIFVMLCLLGLPLGTWAAQGMLRADDGKGASLMAHAGSNPTGAVTLSTPYPNPATEQTSLQYHIEQPFQQAQLRVYDMLGKHVTSIVLTQPSGSVTVPVRTLRNGIYFCALEVDGNTLLTRKLAVSR